MTDISLRVSDISLRNSDISLRTTDISLRTTDISLRKIACSQMPIEKKILTFCKQKPPIFRKMYHYLHKIFFSAFPLFLL